MPTFTEALGYAASQISNMQVILGGLLKSLDEAKGDMPTILKLIEDTRIGVTKLGGANAASMDQLNAFFDQLRVLYTQASATAGAGADASGAMARAAGGNTSAGMGGEASGNMGTGAAGGGTQGRGGDSGNMPGSRFGSPTARPGGILDFLNAALERIP